MSENIRTYAIDWGKTGTGVREITAVDPAEIWESEVVERRAYDAVVRALQEQNRNMVKATENYDRICAQVARLEAELAAAKRSEVSAITRQHDILSGTIGRLTEVAEKLAATLESVRSQMCWERDRDELTMGMTDLHTSVTEALKAWTEFKLK